jgi:tetratricopeptide (TPR) repeat protein
MPVANLLSRAGCAVLCLLLCVPVMAQDASNIRAKIAALEQQGKKYLQEQKPQLAIPVLQQIVSLDPKNLNAEANLGVLLYFQGNYAAAIPHMRTALQLKGDLWRIQALLGMAEKRTGDPKLAQKDLERALPNLDDKKIQIEAGLELIELDMASVQLDEALAVAIKLQKLAPRNPRVLLVSYELSRQTMDQTLLSIMMTAPESAEMHMMMAGELGRQGDHTNAIAQYREALRLNPTLPGAHFELAEQLRTSSDAALNAQAEAEYKAALQINEYDAISWRQLGGIMTAKGDFKMAQEDYRRALALQPKDSEAKAGLAIALLSTNQTNDAISLLESALEDDPTNLVAHYRLSVLYRRTGRTADAQRETDTFHHYQEVKDRLGKVFKQLAGQSKNPM